MGGASNEKLKIEVKGKEKGSKIQKRKWTKKEDAALVAALTEICDIGWKRDNNIFKSGYTAVLEKELKSKLPGCNLKASPHIESRLKTLKKHCDAITDMRGTIGIQWNSEEHSVICEDDDVWEDWVKAHSDAKGLRNRPFPHYDDLCIIFGKNRTNQKGVENTLNSDKVLDSEEANSNSGNLVRAESFERKKRHKCKHAEIESTGKELDCEEANDNAATLMGADVSKNVCKELDHDVANNLAKNVMGADGSDDDASIDSVQGAQNQMQGGSAPTKNVNKKRSRSSDRWSSGLGEVAKIFGTLLEKNEKHFSILVGLLGREAAADNVAAEKRARLNGELTKIPNLSLQARLRAASLIVSDPPKLDLFYSLPVDERREWVSMLLTGLI